MQLAFERARKALGFLESHRLDPSPANYAMALHYITQPSSELGREVREMTDDGLRLTAEQAALLVLRHVDTAAAPQIAARERTMSDQAAQLTTLTTGAHELTTTLQRDVGAFAADKDGWPDTAEAFSSRLTRAERELAEMRREMAALRDSIGSTAATGRTPGSIGGGGGDSPADPIIDTLTDALTRHGAEAVLAQLEHYDRGFALVLIQLDDLVGINDRYGQSVGNNVLSALAATLREAFEDEQLIRWSGNEFLIIMMDTAITVVRDMTRAALDRLAARRLRLRDNGAPIGVVTASAAILTARGEAGDDVLVRARERLVAGRNRGGNRIEG